MTVPAQASPESFLGGFTYSKPDPRLVEYVGRVRQLVPDGRKLRDRLADVEQAASVLSREGCKLSPCCRSLGEGPYGRNLIYQDSDYGFVLISMVWPAGTDAPVHDHGTWCSVAVFGGQGSNRLLRESGGNRSRAPKRGFLRLPGWEELA